MPELPEVETISRALDTIVRGKTIASADGAFKHPVDLGNRNTWQCAACHQGDRTFRHPLNLGDISRFQCAECHKAGGTAAAF